eukprot:753669-Hanusia_phi.AAC.1
MIPPGGGCPTVHSSLRLGALGHWPHCGRAGATASAGPPGEACSGETHLALSGWPTLEPDLKRRPAPGGTGLPGWQAPVALCDCQTVIAARRTVSADGHAAKPPSWRQRPLPGGERSDRPCSAPPGRPHYTAWQAEILDGRACRSAGP